MNLKIVKLVWGTSKVKTPTVQKKPRKKHKTVSGKQD